MGDKFSVEYIFVQTHYGPMHPHLYKHLMDFFCLSFCFSLVRVPESKVNQASSFLGSGEVYSGLGGGRVWFSETSGCLVSGVVSRQPNR